MIDLFLKFIVPAAYAILPEQMATPAASALLLSIGLQESGFLEREQIGGPAHGFFQFERIGVMGVLASGEAGAIFRECLERLRYSRAMTAADIHTAITHNDVLATCLARCLLWSDPRALPTWEQAPQGWAIYTGLWRPGKPRPAEWRDNFNGAWQRVIPNLPTGLQRA